MLVTLNKDCWGLDRWELRGEVALTGHVSEAQQHLQYLGSRMLAFCNHESNKITQI
jgi:hypothetical protein